MSRLEQVLSELQALETATAAQSGAQLRRIDPRAKLLVTLLFVAVLSTCPPRPAVALFALYPVVTALWGGVGIVRTVRRSLAVLPFVAFIGLFNLFQPHGWVVWTGLLWRGLLSVQALLLLIATTGYRPICQALRQLGVPSFFVVQLLLIYRYLRVIVEEALSMQRARRARSLSEHRSWPLWGTMVGQLLLRTLTRAERIHRAMTARGFRGEAPAPHTPLVWHPADSLYIIGWSAVFVLIRSGL